MEAKEQITVGGDEIIVDNGSGATSTTGTWTNKSSGSAYNGGYELASSNNTPSTYRWTPTITAGDYEVYAWWVSSGGYSNNVPYTIAHNGQTATVNRSHKSGGGQWDLLGSWTFDGSAAEYIEISNANGKASADGIRLVKALSTVTQVNRYYVHNDHLGTPQSVTNDSGQEVWRADYRPFGEPTINADVDGDANLLVMNVRFPGQYYDAESGNHYNYFRDYNPGIGRYMQSDPIGLGGGMNTYAYVGGNPLSFIDFLGLMTECMKKAFSETEACREIIELGASLTGAVCGVSDIRDIGDLVRRKISKEDLLPDDVCERVRDEQNKLHDVCTESLYKKLDKCESIEQQETCN